MRHNSVLETADKQIKYMNNCKSAGHLYGMLAIYSSRI